MIIKTDNPDYVRDITTGVLINTDTTGYSKVMSQINELKRTRALESRMNNIEKDMSDIKNLLTQLINKAS